MVMNGQGLSRELQAAAESGDARALKAIAKARDAKGPTSEGALARALAKLAEGDPEGAERALEAGLAVAPSWFLCGQLAVVRLLQGRTAEVVELWEQALGLPGSPRGVVVVELAAALVEDEQFERAEELLAGSPEVLGTPAGIAVRLRALVELERFAEVRILAETARAELLEGMDSEELAECSEDLATIEVARAFAAQAAGQKREAREAALEALSWARGHDAALDLLRELGRGPHPKGRRYQVQAIVEIPLEERDELEPSHWRAEYEVIAESVGDIHGYLAAVEPEDWSSSVTIEDVEDLGPEPEEPLGVVAMSDLEPLEEGEASAEMTPEELARALVAAEALGDGPAVAGATAYDAHDEADEDEFEGDEDDEDDDDDLEDEEASATALGKAKPRSVASEEEYRFPGLDEDPPAVAAPAPARPAALRSIPPVPARSLPAAPPDEDDEQEGQGFRLQGFLKWLGVVETGGEAKTRIQAGEVKVNGEVDTRRGRRLKPGDRVTLDRRTHVVPPESKR